MRRIVLLVFAVGLVAAGVYLVSLVAQHPTIYALIRGLGVGLLLAGLGGFILWDDFVGPLLSRRSRNDP